MNLTKSLKWAMVCAGVTALSASALNGPWVSESFDFSGVNVGDGIIQQVGSAGDWYQANGQDDSKIAAGNAATEGYLGDTPLNGLDTMVLELNTEGATLIRKLPSGVSFASTTNYVDMMVKFVLSEDTPDLPDVKVKTLVYANANSNLVVWVNDFIAGDFDELVNAKIDPEQWYRLTLTWYQNESFYSAFMVQLNGGEPLAGALGYSLEDGSEGGPVFFSAATYLDLGGEDPWDAETTLYSIEFQGTGFIDELVVTDVAPDFGEPGIKDFEFNNTGVKVDQNAYNTWAGLYGVTVGAPLNQGEVQVTDKMLNAFLLNVDPGDGTAEAYLVITKIVPKGAGLGGAEVTVAAVDGTGTPVPLPPGPYGTVEVWTTPALEQTFYWEYDFPNPQSAILLPGGNVNKYFYKVGVRAPSVAHPAARP